MLPKIKKAGLCLVVGVLLLACSGAPAGGEVQYLDADGLLQKIAESKGKVVVVNFWATWCPACRQELPELVKLREKFDDEKLLVIGASVDDSLGKLKRFLAKWPLNYQIYQASDDAAMLYGVQSIPVILMYDPKGELMIKHTGFASFEQLRLTVDKLASN
jgi:thiol-disulfide isomerase/thioredoxin